MDYRLDDEFVKFLLSLKRTNKINAKIILAEYYETKTKIFDHTNIHTYSPLSSVAFHDAEDITKDSLLEEAIKYYIKYDIFKVFGLNLVEYLKLPPDIIQMLERLATNPLRDKNNALKKIEEDLKAME